MSNYTIANLLEVEDSYNGRVPGLEGHFARKHLESRDLGVSLFRFEASVQNPKSHSHKEQEEAFVVVNGSGRVRLDDEVVMSVLGGRLRAHGGRPQE